MKTIVLIILSFLVSISSFAGSDSVPDRWKLKVDSSGEISGRYDYQEEDSRERLQTRVRLRFAVDLDNNFKLVAMASTGSSYASDWGTVKDINAADSSLQTPELALRRLFLQYEDDNGRIQVGSIPTIKGRRSAFGLDRSGWIDGVRVERNFADGDGIIEIVAGSIDDLDETNVFKRDRDLNFFEVEISKTLFNDLVGEIKFEHFQGNDFFQAVIKDQFEIAGDKIISYVAEYFGRIGSSDARGAVFTAETDLLKLLLNKYDGKLNLSLGFQFVDEELGLRAELNDDHFVFGKLVRVGMNGNISKKRGVNWFANGYFGREDRVNIGVRFRWK